MVKEKQERYERGYRLARSNTMNGSIMPEFSFMKATTTDEGVDFAIGDHDEEDEEDEEEKRIKAEAIKDCMKILRFLQLLCENHNDDLQN